MKSMKYEFSDTISGYASAFDASNESFILTTTDGVEHPVKLTSQTFARGLRNLNEDYSDVTGDMRNLLKDGQYLSAYGIFYPQKGTHVFEAKIIDFPDHKSGTFRFEEPNWWINQAKSICDFFLKSQFGSEDNINYDNYRTTIGLAGQKDGSYRQETDTISRMIYGFASTYLMTGEDKYLEVAEKGTQYLRDHMRFYDYDENIIYWYHGVDYKETGDTKILASEFGDDYDAIPMYEQIYALAGPTQTYRVNGDPSIMKDIQMTMDLFERFYLDKEQGGYFSHLDPITLNPRSESLGQNRAKKNWNSVGDHAPAYLINLWLATKDEKHKKILEYTADCIEKYFPDYQHSPFVQERFHEDWSHDKTWGWQQDTAVVGHNLKIAWNLMRINSDIPKVQYVNLAKKIAEVMPTVGIDNQRGGCYDVMQRTLREEEEVHRFAWHDRKAWWQQEQLILAYQIMYGVLRDEKYLKLAREGASFYSIYQLDHDDGAVYFNVLNNGLPYLLGNERKKGSHSMSAYHSVELAYLSTVYINLLHTKQPVDLYFKPHVHGFVDNILNVEPDMLPKGAAHITKVWIDDQPWFRFDADNFTVDLPNLPYRPKIKVRIEAK
jgi:mannose/cellobiose epimerase-like protein (N-acyl-D-glucosamine 2-epimerase family)